MLSAGVPLNQSLALSAEAIDNKFLEQRILEMKSQIESGVAVSATAINAKIFTPLVIQMMSVGEETGRIDELLLEVSDFYDREVDYDLKHSLHVLNLFYCCLSRPWCWYWRWASSFLCGA